MAIGSALHLSFIPSDSSALGENQPRTNSVDTLASPPFVGSTATGKWHYLMSSEVNKCNWHMLLNENSKEV